MKGKKKCPKCAKTKELNAFAKQTASKDGLRPICKTCTAIYMGAYRAKNKEKAAAYWKAYYAKHKKEFDAKQRTYQTEHKEELGVKAKIYYAKHKEERKEERIAYGKMYRAEHKEENVAYRKEHKEEIAAHQKAYKVAHSAKLNAYNTKRRAEKLHATPSWANKEKILDFYKEAQRLTEETGVLHEVDHIYPLQGKTCSGLNVENNLQVITRAENRSKSNRAPEEFYKHTHQEIK